MTITFRCDLCSKVMAYDEDRSVLFNSMDKERRKDLCPECAIEIEDIIENGISPAEDKTLGLRRNRK